MDPDAALEAARNAASNIQRFFEGTQDVPDLIGEVESLVEHFGALDGWLGKGGFLPNDWKHPGLRRGGER